MERSYRQYGTALRQWLRQCYPRVDHGLVEDAVADSFVDVLADPEVLARARERDGESTLRALLRMIAWRRLRGYLRKKDMRSERVDMGRLEAADTLTPQEILAGRETATRVLALVEVAAVRFGGSRSDALRTALHDRLAGGTDTEAARLHGLPREYVNRAKRWLGSQLRAA